MQFIFLSAISIVLPEFIWLFRSAQLSSGFFCCCKQPFVANYIIIMADLDSISPAMPFSALISPKIWSLGGFSG